jgi:hypothetical protein
MKKLLQSIASVFGILLLVSLFSCKGERYSESQLMRYLDSQEEIFEQISVSMGTEYWKFYNGDGKADLESPRQQFAELFGNESLNFMVDTWYSKRERIKDGGLRRRIELWHNILAGAKVNLGEEVLSLASHLETWLAAGADPEKTPSPEELEAMTLKLMKLRNMRAKELGYNNYAGLILEITGLGSDWFYSFVKALDEATLVPYQNLISKIKAEESKPDIGVADVRKLMIQYRMLTSGPQIGEEKTSLLMRETLENIGIRFDGVPIQFEERKMPPGIDGQGIAVQIPNDFRVVLAPGIPFESVLHELGHGLQWVFTDATSPILKGYEWSLGNICGAFSEGMAETTARFSQNPEWQKKYVDSSDEELLANKAKIQSLAPAYLRILMNVFMFEVEFYKDLDQDPDELVQNLQERYLLVDEPLKTQKRLANMMYVSYPLYAQNYLIADIISWQVHKALEEKFGKDYAFNKGTGPYLKETLWKNGELYTWQMRLVKATGKELDIEGYLRALGL